MRPLSSFLPRLEVMHGKAEIQKHCQQLFDAGATNFALKITQVELSGNDAGVMAGNYTVLANETISGHWFEILRARGGDMEDRGLRFRSARADH
jgi:hypothetical protein